jgi:hypothetical protein
MTILFNIVIDITVQCENCGNEITGIVKRKWVDTNEKLERYLGDFKCFCGNPKYKIIEKSKEYDIPA